MQTKHNHTINDPLLIPDDEWEAMERRRGQVVLTRMSVEDCFLLPIGILGKGLLSKPDIIDPYPRPIGTPTRECVGKEGTVRIGSQNEAGRVIVHYRVVLDRNASLRLQIARDGVNPVFYDQAVRLEESYLSFGSRPYFLCPLCFEPKATLYLRPDMNEFLCRRCNNLIYESQLLNPNKYRLFLYAMRKLAKIMVMKSRMQRFAYRGMMTKRAVRLQRAIEKYQNLVKRAYTMNHWKIDTTTAS